MRRKITLTAGQAQRVAAVSAVLSRGIDEATGEVLGPRVVVERVGWVVDLVRDMATGLLAAHWNLEDVARLAGGTDDTGRPLPSQVCKALRRLGWTVTVPEGVRVNDRVTRMAQETAGRLLRSASWRVGLVGAVLATWPKDPDKRTPEEWDALRDAVADGRGRAVATGILRGRTRQTAEFLRRHGRLPKDLFELEAPPRAPRLLVLAVCDRQQATLARCPDDPDRFAVLRVQLPTRADPRSYRDWTWVAIRFRLPPTVPSDAALHLPTLRLTRDGKADADLAFTHAVPAVCRTGHTVALGVDWGLNCLLTVGTVRLAEDPDGRRGCVTDSRTVMFRAGGILAKADRVRHAGEAVSAKVNQQRRLLDGRAARGVPDDAALRARHDLLAVEQTRVAERRRRLNTALANTAANWLTRHAVAAGASVVYFEDLRDLEARGKGRNLNTRLSQTVRGQLVAVARHAAAKHGIAVVVVPARETSKRCPRCLTALRHCKAPDRPGERGWKWARCPNLGCGWTGDRDAGAWQRIASRGLLHQQQTVHDRAGGHLLVGKVDPELDARSGVQLADGLPGRSRPRSKPKPARRRSPRRCSPRRRVGRARHSRSAPRQRRRAPSPHRPGGNSLPGGCGHRPEGHGPRLRNPATASVMVVWSQADAPAAPAGGRCTTIGPAPCHQGRHRKRHRPRGARLGAGFHLGAHATRPGTNPADVGADRNVGFPQHPSTSQGRSVTMPPTNSTAAPTLSVPAPAPVRLDPRTTALVVMDITDPLCTGRPDCVASVPRIAALLADARAGGAHVLHTVGPKLPTVILDPVAPHDAEPIVRARADKFHGSDLDDRLRERGVTTLLLVGTAANGAVMYTAFAANLRGYTVAVAVDAISADDGETTRFVGWQLLHQPGYTNPDNEPLRLERVTLTRTDLVTFADVEH